MKHWKTKDGRKIQINKMSDSHLTNAIKFLEKTVESIKWNIPYPYFQGEMAQDAAENEWNRLIEAEVEEFFPIYSDLCMELEKRKKNHETTHLHP